ncbi:hypothetical protein EK21DRAFT_114654 [Setomelanomma holmii]|uniref:Uncharacterized protein n=1 Tax=Setomelanomma holmii TaxID=210430 RepID=A0A9P4H4U4_9PLEO|nr:hypothetical protein EK21DRAFT_114654 [Setomelanomma holmii]
MAVRHSSTFRFMDLPVELRLMVYDFLPIRTKHVMFDGGNVEFYAPIITAVVYQVPVQVLRVCKGIRDDAQSILKVKMKVVKNITPRVMMDTSCTELLLGEDGLLTFNLFWFMALEDNGDADFRKWLAKRTATGHSLAKMQGSVLQFLQQAGLQMLEQGQKQNSVDSDNFTVSDDFSFYFALNMQDHLHRETHSMPTNGVDQIHARLRLSGLMMRHLPWRLQADFRCWRLIRTEQSTADAIFRWRVPPGSQGRSNAKSASRFGIGLGELGKRLQLDEGWQVEERLC